MYTLLIGKERWNYKTYSGLKRRLALQAETESNGANTVGSIRAETLHGVEVIGVTFYKSLDGISFGWDAVPGIPQV